MSTTPSKPMLTGERFRVAIAAAAEVFGVESSDILGPRRSHEIAMARHVAVAALKIETAASCSEIGRRVKRDHTTVLYAVQTAVQRAVADPDFARGLATVMGAIRETAPPASDRP